MPQPQSDHDAVAPPGWEQSIKKMKKSGGIDNPWALSWYMKNRGMKPHHPHSDEDAAFDAALLQALAEVQARGIPAHYLAAARGEVWAVAQVQRGPLVLERRWERC